MRILIAYSTRYPRIRGGVDTMIVSLVDQLRRRHDVMLFAAGKREERNLTRSEEDGIATYVMHLRLPFYAKFEIRNFVAWLLEFPRSVLTLRRLVRTERIDIVHVHMLNRYYLPFVALRLLGGPPYAVTLHRAEVIAHPGDPWMKRFISKLILRNASVVNAVSHALAREAEQVFPFAAPIVGIPNGLDHSKLPSASPCQPEPTINRKLPERYFTAIGTLQRYKGHDVAIEAWAKLIPACPDLHLVLIGDGQLAERYRKLIQSLGLTERVHLLGALPRPVALSIARNGLGFVMPSRNEGIGYALLEAGALGLPVVCTDIGPFVEVVRNEESALVVPVEDSAALAKAVQRLVASPELRQKLGTAFQETVSSVYSSEQMARSYEKLFQGVLAS